MKGLKIINI